MTEPLRRLFRSLAATLRRRLSYKPERAYMRGR